jgi:hypothetical protein
VTSLFAREPATSGWVTPGEVWGLAYDSTEGVWPRFMTVPHPRATGTYGHDFIRWAESKSQAMLNPKKSPGLRWWQKLVALRVLEHDEAGRLVWEKIILTVARQSGKSWFMRCLLMWRTVHGEGLFGETQTCLHVAHKIVAAQEVWRPATRWAIHNYGQNAVRFANGEQQITTPDGGRWLIQAANDGAGVSMSLSMALVDEAWRVKREVVDGAITPTMAEAEQPQLFLVSTAGDSTSDLMISYRDQGIEATNEPTDLLILEWSASPEADADDEAAWRAASPFWSPRRRAVVAAARLRATEAEFRSQWLNQWQPSIDDSQSLMPVALWNSLAGTLPPFGEDSTIVVGVEDNFGEGASVALAWLDPHSDLVAGIVREFDRLPEAWLAVSEYRERWPNCKVEVGATLGDDPLLVDVVGYGGAILTGSTETRLALPLLRELAAQHRLRHDGAQALTRQVLGLQVRASVSGGLGIVGIDQRRTDGVRAFARAVMTAHRSVGVIPAIY